MSDTRLPKNAAQWVAEVNRHAVLAIARKAAEGGSHFRGGRSPMAKGQQPNFQCELPDGRVVRHNLSPKFVVGDLSPEVTFDEDNLSDVLDDYLRVFLHGYNLGAEHHGS